MEGWMEGEEGGGGALDVSGLGAVVRVGVQHALLLQRVPLARNVHDPLLILAVELVVADQTLHQLVPEREDLPGDSH
eukprot:1236637-Rhodomonas_salina.8